MKLITKTAAVLLLLMATIGLMASIRSNSTNDSVPFPVTKNTGNFNSKIQVAILLDVSGSMDGLIEQAKSQLWNMVSVMGKAKCDDVVPQIEIALYEYGRTTNDVKKGYVKQINAFTSDLDLLSKNLFSLTTNGGDEYCGQVIYSSLAELKWDNSPKNYKVIFIAGNEDFLQGPLTYSKACEEAKRKGVIVNTIYCGDRMQGIKEHWNLAGECGSGSYSVIDQNEREKEIPTPYDDMIFTLNQKLNGTYIYYGDKGEEKYAEQASVDQMNFVSSKAAAAKRVAVKGKENLYNNDSWDLVDAVKKDEKLIEKVDLKSLPKEMQNKSRQEIKLLIKDKSDQRSQVRLKIDELSKKREAFILKEKLKENKGTTSTLESEIEKIIKSQAKRFNMKIED